jgi:hypothetical protein
MPSEVVLSYSTERHGFVVDAGVTTADGAPLLRRYCVVSPHLPPLRGGGGRNLMTILNGSPVAITAAAAAAGASITEATASFTTSRTISIAEPTASAAAPTGDFGVSGVKSTMPAPATTMPPDFRSVTYVIKTPAPVIGATGTTAAAVKCPRGLHTMHRLTIVPTVDSTLDAASSTAPTDNSAAVATTAQALALTTTTAVEKDQEKLGLLLITLRVRAALPFTACAQCRSTTGIDLDATGTSNAKYTRIDADGSRIDVPPSPPQVAPRAVWVCLHCEAALCDACCEKQQLAAVANWGGGGGGGGGGHKVPVTPSNWRGAGARVCRGPSWEWYDQDGGEGGMGTVIDEDCAGGWITVVWDHDNSENGYRADDTHQDLCYC